MQLHVFILDRKSGLVVEISVRSGTSPPSPLPAWHCAHLRQICSGRLGWNPEQIWVWDRGRRGKRSSTAETEFLVQMGYNLISRGIVLHVVYWYAYNTLIDLCLITYVLPQVPQEELAKETWDLLSNRGWVCCCLSYWSLGLPMKRKAVHICRVCLINAIIIFSI